MKPRRTARRTLLLTLCAAWLLALPAKAAEVRSLEIGLAPSLTARALLTAYEPMRAYLERQLQQPVRLSTAPNLREFYARTQKSEFDLVVTPAHLAWLAHREAGYTPVLTYVEPLSGLLVVARDSPIQNVAALRGKRLGMADPLGIVNLRGLQALREQGLREPVDFSLQVIAPQNATALAVAQGSIDAAIMSTGAYHLMAADIRAQLRVLTEIGAVPNVIYMLHSRLPPPRQGEVQKALLAYGATTEGRDFLSEYRHGGFKPISLTELKPMASYAEPLKRLLEGDKPTGK